MKKEIKYQEVNGCHICTSHCKDKDGYCQIRISNRQQKLHRYIYSINNNISLEDMKGKVVMHSCDNPSCINPDHLSLGTIADNNHDRDSKGRTSTVGNKGNVKGEINGRSKLTTIDVKAIKTWLLLGYTVKELATLFEVHRSTIDNIRSGFRWSHITIGGDVHV